MSDESTQKDRGERGRFLPGGPGGPGRPKRGQTAAEIYRRGTDWEAVRARLEKIALHGKDNDATAAARELADRAFGKPLASHELNVATSQSGAPVRDWSKVPIADRIALLEKLRGVPELTGDSTTEGDG